MEVIVVIPKPEIDEFEPSTPALVVLAAVPPAPTVIV